jgi:tetratricopeptide (TPR) repeat protein
MCTKLLCASAILFAVSCTKTKEPPAKAEPAKAAAPAPAPAQQPAVPATAAQELPVTSSFPQAIQSFRKGRELLENARVPEARQLFEKAIELDPKFAQAHAFLGGITPGAEGAKHFAEAASLSGALPEPERILIEHMRADHEGQEEKALALLRKLAMLAPGDWRVQLQLGQRTFFYDWNLEEALAAMRKASSLNPKRGEPYNIMAYALAFQGKHDEALDAVRKYAALKAEEPNPQDTMAEILLMAGRFEEAEAGFRKALALSPKFQPAWEGIAMSKFYRRDWAGGREALARYRELGTRPDEKLRSDVSLARSYEAQGNAAEALRVLDAVDKEAALLKAEEAGVSAPLDRARVHLNQGKAKEALAHTAEAFRRLEQTPVSGKFAQHVRVAGNLMRLRAQARMGKVEEAVKTLAALESEAQKAPNAWFRSFVHLAQGTIAMAKKDAAGAARHFAECLGMDTFCRWQLALAQEKSGDRAGAEATRAKIRSIHHRDMSYLYVWSKLGAAASK